MRQRVSVGRLVNAVAEDELVLGSELHVVCRLQLAVAHVVFLHAHEGSIPIRFAEAVPLTQGGFLLLVLLQPRQKCAPYLTYDPPALLCGRTGLQARLQTVDGFRQLLTGEG